MTTEISVSAKNNTKLSTLIVATKKSKWADFGFSKAEVSYLEKKIKADDTFITINQFERLVFVQLTEEFEKKNEQAKLEGYLQIHYNYRLTLLPSSIHSNQWDTLPCTQMPFFIRTMRKKAAHS